MKIGLDAFPLEKRNAGQGFYIFHILEAWIRMRPDCLFFLYATKKTDELNYFLRYTNVRLRISSFLGKSHSLWRLITHSLMIFGDDLDIYWGSTQFVPLFKRKKLRTMITLYD